MNLLHKLQKLVRVDGIQSAWEHAQRWSHPVDARPMLQALDPAGVARLRARYLDPGHPEDVGNSTKFADADYWLKVNVERAQDLRLDQRPPLRVLDLGCGAGYFVYVCKRLGHQATGFDLDENALYRETIELLGVERIVGRIDAFTKLPDLGGRYDLVTAHCICFQKVPDASGPDGWRDWGADEWRFFLDDVRANVLKPDGQLVLDFNPRRSGIHYPPEVKTLFQGEGARLFRSKVILPAAKPGASV